MKTKVLVVTLLFLAFGLLVGTHVQAQLPSPNPNRPAGAPKGQIPPMIQKGITALVNSKASLANVASKDAHLEKAIGLIDQALAVCGQTQTPPNANINSSPTAEKAPMQAAIRQLTAAKNHFTNAKNPWGGRRDQALALINQALQEVQSGNALAKNNSNKQPQQQQQTMATQGASTSPTLQPKSPIPPAIKAGIEAMVNSKSSLENAGDLGGHKQNAINLIDQALTACGQTPTPNNGGTTSSATDDTAVTQAALKQLTAAKNHFTNAKNPWGGRRDQALALINQALGEVQSGLAVANNSSNNSNTQPQQTAATNNSNIPPQQTATTNNGNIQQLQTAATNNGNTPPQQQQQTGTTNGGNTQQQQQQQTTSQPVARSMAEFRKSPAGVARAQKLDKNFSAASKTFKYPDSSSLTLTMVKKPAFGGQGTSIQPKVSPDKAKKPEHSTDAKGQQWTCSTEHVTLTATSTTFLNNDYSSSASHIYPGASYTFADFYNGSYKEQTGQRNPVSLITDSTNIKGSSFVTVANPNMGTIRNAVDSLFRETTNANAQESTTYQIYETTNDADQSIKISGGASGYGASISGGYGNSSQSKTIYLTIDAIKTLFSINTIPPTNGFFTDPKVEATPNLMVIGSVSYGVRVLANLSVTFNSQQEEADFKGAYSGFGISAHVAFDQISKSQSVSDTINAYIVGGPGSTTLALTKKDLEGQIKKILSGATYKNAQPVKYEFYDMAGDVVGSKSATDTFAVRNCIPGKDDPRLESVSVEFQVGDDNKNPDDNYTLLLYPGGVNLDNPEDLQKFVFAYNQAATPEAGLEYQPNASYTVKLEQAKPVTLSQFKNGGALMLSIFPNGNDTWKNNAILVTMSFEGGLGPSTPIKYSNISIAQNGTHRILYFDGTFTALQK